MTRAKIKMSETIVVFSSIRFLFRSLRKKHYDKTQILVSFLLVLNCRKIPTNDSQVPEVPDLLSDLHGLHFSAAPEDLSAPRVPPWPRHDPETFRPDLRTVLVLRFSTPFPWRHRPQTLHPFTTRPPKSAVRVPFPFPDFGSRVSIVHRRTIAWKTSSDWSHPRPLPPLPPRTCFLAFTFPNPHYTLKINYNRNNHHNNNNSNNNCNSNENRLLIRSCNNTKQIATSV